MEHALILCLREEFVSIYQCLLLNDEMTFLQTSLLHQGLALSDLWKIDRQTDSTFTQTYLIPKAFLKT